MGLWRGKKGSSVFYYLRNSNNREKQGIREYQPVVANPQTAAQIDQRMYLAPAQNVYRELADVIRRSWQGLEYGGKGTQQFFKGALRHGTTRPVGIPWLDKGDTRAVPGTYQISNGSIGEVVVTITDADTVATTLIGIVPPSQDEMTWGDYSTALIANNDLKQGDQITFVTCASNEEYPPANSRFGWSVDSIYVDINSTEVFADLYQFKFVTLGYQDGRLIMTNNGDNPFPFLQAAAVIVSRLGSTGTYQRSNATIAVNTEGMAYWYTANRHDLARTTYYQGASGTRSGNWVVDDNAGTNPATRDTIEGTYTLSGLTGNYASCNGTPVRVIRYADDDSLAAVYVTIVTEEGSEVRALVDSRSGQAVEWWVEGGAFGYLKPANVADLANLPTQVTG